MSQSRHVKRRWDTTRSFLRTRASTVIFCSLVPLPQVHTASIHSFIHPFTRDSDMADASPRKQLRESARNVQLQSARIKAAGDATHQDEGETETRVGSSDDGPFEITIRSKPSARIAFTGSSLRDAVDQLVCEFHAWNREASRIGHVFQCTIAGVATMQPRVHAALFRMLRAVGFAVLSAIEGEIERSGQVVIDRRLTPATCALIDRLHGAFHDWSTRPVNANSVFTHDFRMHDLPREEHAALSDALVKRGFAVDARHSMFHVMRAMDPPAKARTSDVDDQVAAATIVNEANRQFTQWLILVKCQPTVRFAMLVRMAHVSVSGRRLVEHLLRASGFSIELDRNTTEPSVFLVQRNASRQLI